MILNIHYNFGLCNSVMMIFNCLWNRISSRRNDRFISLHSFFCPCKMANTTENICRFSLFWFPDGMTFSASGPHLREAASKRHHVTKHQVSDFRLFVANNPWESLHCQGGCCTGLRLWLQCTLSSWLRCLKSLLMEFDIHSLGFLPIILFYHSAFNGSEECGISCLNKRSIYCVDVVECLKTFIRVKEGV